MKLLVIQPYIKIQQEIIRNEKIETKQERNIHLYDEKITTRYREFSIEDVLDMSYRQVGGGGGLLYLHTSRGLFSYTVKESPEKLINAFKELSEK
ncbi:hypothetical protein ACFQ3N_15790 [Virgibacillus byunsanensis]|uniref:DUF304 domain-containing protein n=1 Tax=Virgibacillus byunsanensis TaxID=570945 RepID=A0ABW3LPG8_9BACI